MNAIKKFLALTALALGVALPGAGFAQANMMAMPRAASMTDGEIRKIDKDNGKLTIKHGEIKHMEMPGMTMVFVAKDKALLDKTSVGAKIQFMVTNENGQMTVTDIQPVK